MGRVHIGADVGDVQNFIGDSWVHLLVQDVPTAHTDFDRLFEMNQCLGYHTS